MVRITAIAALLASACWTMMAGAFVPTTTRTSSSSLAPAAPQASSTRMHMAIDYNDPVVAEEFAKVQPMVYEDVAEELQAKGIPVPPTMNDMEAKLMLVEMRLRFSGKLAGQKKKEKPKKFGSKFEEYMWTKPAFAEFYNELKAKGDHNAQNVVTEFCTDKVLAEKRYGKTYRGILNQAERALTAPPPVKSPKLKFSGFPANMGEDACKMTLEALGPIVSFSCATDDDFPILRGEVEYEDIVSAKKAVAQYHGMDMGMGSTIEVESL